MRNISLFVLIDALGWRLLEGREFLSDLLPYRYPLRTVLGFSSGAIPTILTGLPPARHGHWNLLYYDPKNSPFWWLRYFGFLPDSVLDTRVGRKVIQQLGRRVLGMGPGFECCVSPRLMRHFNWAEKRNIYAEGGLGAVPCIFDQLAARGVDYRVYSYHDASDEDILSRARRDLAASNATFFFVYLSEMDSFLHAHCADPERLTERLAWYEEALRRLFAAARAEDPDAAITVFSDHGMAPVRQHVDLMAEVSRAGLNMPREYLAVYDSTMARFWFFSDKARREITSALRNVPLGRIVPEAELKDLGVCFEDQRYGELVFLLDPGCMMARGDFNGPQWMPAGMHGYHPEDVHSDAIFLSNRPPTQPVRTIADVWRCMDERTA